MPRKKREYKYKSADKFIVYHEEDRDLDTIVITLPKPPPLETIEGYGLPPEQQMFKRTVWPEKFRVLQAKQYENVEDYWDEIERDWEYYKDDMWFIDQEWERRMNGYWLFINGKPTWLCGWHYFYLNYWPMDSDTGDGYSEYRDRDRKSWIFWYWAYTDPLVLGVNYPKHRREGATTRAQCVNFLISTMPMGGFKVEIKSADGGLDAIVKTGVQSKTETDAQDAFRLHFFYAFRKMVFWFKPVSDNNQDPKKMITYKAPAKSPFNQRKKKKAYKLLRSEVDARSSAETAYDSRKLRFYHGDEVGKTIESNVLKRHDVVRECLTLGANTKIIGFAVYTSTVGEMEKKGGKNFASICRQSHLSRRSKTTRQTASGMVNLFIPADEGNDGQTPDGVKFMDEFGASRKQLAHESILALIASKEEAEDWEGAAEVKRLFPLQFRDCFARAGQEERFNMAIIQDVLSHFDVHGYHKNVRFGRFEWYGDPRWEGEAHGYKIHLLPTPDDIMTGKARVRFVETGPENYDWEISYLFEDDSMSNQWEYDWQRRRIMPKNQRHFSQGSDPFRIRGKTTSGKASNGAGTIYREYDPSVDDPRLERIKNQINPETGDFYWVTDRFCGVYNKRPQMERYCEQQLMASIYYGCRNFSESQVTAIISHYEIRGFHEYLYHYIDDNKKEERENPGHDTSEKIKDEIWNAIADHIEKNGRRELHPTLFEQCEEIDLDMNDYDVFAACGYAKLQSRNRFIHRRNDVPSVQQMNYSQIFPTYDT